MAHQLDHLAAMAERPNVTLHVLPGDRLVHSHGLGPFHIRGFPGAGDHGVVYVDHRSGAAYLDAPEEVYAYELVFRHMCVLARSPDESVALVRHLAKEMRHD